MTAAQDPLVSLLVERALVTQDQIAEARRIQQQMESMGLRARSVPDVLVEKGWLDGTDLESLQKDLHTVEGRDQVAGYKLLELVGRGSMGAVYKAKQLSLDRVVALKVLDPELARDEAYVARFLKEARAVARLSHTNLVSGIDVGEEGGVRYLAMEFADGVTLARVLRRGGALDEERALWLGTQIGRALEYAHKNGLVHGDLRPENVIITGDGVAKVSDLGVARREADATEEGRELKGSPDYLSPEQARGLENVGPPADLYALGCILFHMLTGRVPFPAEQREATVAKHLTEPAPAVESLAPETSAETSAIVARLLQKNPTERMPSATALLEALDDATTRLKAARLRAAPPSSSARPGAPSSAGGAPVVRRRRRR